MPVYQVYMRDEESLDLLRTTDKEGSTPKETIQAGIAFFNKYAPQLQKFNPDGGRFYDQLADLVENLIEQKKTVMKKAKDKLQQTEV